MKETKYIVSLVREFGEFIYAPASYHYTIYDAIQAARDYYEGMDVVCEFGYAYEYDKGMCFEPALFTLHIK